MFSLFECKDGTFVVVPLGLAPPVAVYRGHGPSIHISDRCLHLYDTDVWDDLSREVERQLYAVVHPDVAFWIFDLPDGSAWDRAEAAPPRMARGEGASAHLGEPPGPEYGGGDGDGT